MSFKNTAETLPGDGHRPCWAEAAALSEQWLWPQLKPGCCNCQVPSGNSPNPVRTYSVSMKIWGTFWIVFQSILFYLLWEGDSPGLCWGGGWPCWGCGWSAWSGRGSPACWCSRTPPELWAAETGCTGRQTCKQKPGTCTVRQCDKYIYSSTLLKCDFEVLSWYLYFQPTAF